MTQTLLITGTGGDIAQGVAILFREKRSTPLYCCGQRGVMHS
jgi:hypothetical protein